MSGGRTNVRNSPSRAAEDYLKAIFKLQEESDPVSTTALAAVLDRSAASVTNMVKALAEQGLLEHEPYHGVRLTQRGETTALGIIRRHRVIETYLIERLGYTWDGVHVEAERLEHAASDDLVDRMASALGDPLEDPHGAPIPSPDGVIESRDLDLLIDLPSGVPAVVREVSDEDAARLRQLASAGFLLGKEIVVLKRSPDALIVLVGSEEHRLESVTAGLIRVERIETK
jgi:DtxR family Mn-dependent transcriptional regulator